MQDFCCACTCRRICALKCLTMQGTGSERTHWYCTYWLLQPPCARCVAVEHGCKYQIFQQQQKKKGKKKKNHSSCAIFPHAHFICSTVQFSRMITTQTANQRAVRLIQSVFFPCRGRSVGLLIVCSRRGSSPGFKNT